MSCAFCACCGIVHVALRSMSAILPAICAAFTNGEEQPSLVVPAPSFTSATVPETPVELGMG